MLNAFYDYLVSMGLSEYTKSGRKSTVYSYCNRIEVVCKNEDISISQLAKDIHSIIPKYDFGEMRTVRLFEMQGVRSLLCIR